MLRILLLTSAFVLTIAVVAGARTWHVRADSTGDAPTIQAAIDSASGGDSVLVAEGLYEEEVVLGPNIVLLGGWDAAFERRDPTGYVTQVSASGSSAHPVQVNTGCEIDGFHVTAYGYHSAAFYCYDVYYGPPEARITNNVITGEGVGIYCRGTSPHIEGNLIKGCGFHPNIYGGGIWCTYDASPTIRRNLIVGNDDNGIYAEFDSSPTIENNTIVDTYWDPNEPWRARGDGIHSHYGASPIVRNNIIAGNRFGVVHTFEGGPVLSCNDIWGNALGSYDGCGPGPTDIHECPSFCNAGFGDYHLCDQSPCLPGGNPCGRLIGAYGGGCSCGPSRTEPTTWGAIKAMYR